MTQVVFIGEAYGANEAVYRAPFVGSAGQELFRLLHKTKFHPHSLNYFHITPSTMDRMWAKTNIPLLNVFNAQPQENNIELFYAGPRDKTPVDREFPVRRFGAKNKYVLASLSDHIRKLHNDLDDLKPNLIVPLGATACWAIGLGSEIGKVRGFVHETKWGKALPTFHPAAVLYNWSLRVTVLLDLAKARRESQFPGIRQVEREIWTEPTIPDLWHWWEVHGSKASRIAFDIETLKKRLISEIAFASDPHHALHIPFLLENKSAPKPYTRFFSSADEVKAWEFVKHVLESPVPKIGQNCVQYDTYWLVKDMNIKVQNIQDDTMTMAHCWQPELGKSLYDLGAIFLDERSWKNIRRNVAKDND